MSLIEVKLRPTGPWRVGDRAGDRERVDVVYHSDALYSAVTHAMRSLGWLEEWLDATARAAGNPMARFSSLFPFAGRTRLVAPPKSVWPPATPGKLYLQAARLIPLEILKSGVVEESRWQVDGESGCMLPMGVSAPFSVSVRAAAAVDRLTGATESHRTACLEFASNAGWWGVFEVSDPVWEARVKSALRLLADSGFGGERSRGWGRAGEPQFSEAAHLFATAGAEGLWWLLSLYSPHATDAVDWSRGEYVSEVRGGWTDSTAGTAAKKQVRMLSEGSVLAAAALRGQVVDVAPDGFAHPVYRSGFALALPAAAEIVVRAVENARPVKAAPVTKATPVVEDTPVVKEEQPSAVSVTEEPAAEPEGTQAAEASAETQAAETPLAEVPVAEPIPDNELPAETPVEHAPEQAEQALPEPASPADDVQNHDEDKPAQPDEDAE